MSRYDKWNPTPEQLARVDALIAQSEASKRREKEWGSDRITSFREMSRPSFKCGRFSEDEISSFSKPVKPKYTPPPVKDTCKIDYYTTTDSEGRMWNVEHRH